MLRFGFAPVKNILKPVYKVPVQVRSEKWFNSSDTIKKMKRTKHFFSHWLANIMHKILVVKPILK